MNMHQSLDGNTSNLRVALWGGRRGPIDRRRMVVEEGIVGDEFKFNSAPRRGGCKARQKGEGRRHLGLWLRLFQVLPRTVSWSVPGGGCAGSNVRCRNTAKIRMTRGARKI